MDSKEDDVKVLKGDYSGRRKEKSKYKKRYLYNASKVFSTYGDFRHSNNIIYN